MFFDSSDVNDVKVSLQQWDLPLTINICEKNYVVKRLLKMFWQKMKSWWGKYGATENVGVENAARV